METDQIIRVMIVDDHAVVRSGLTTFLSVFPDLEMVGDAADGEEAIHVCQVQKPDVILMDLVMPRMNGPEAIKRIREKNPDVQFIALTSFKDEELVQAALQAGAISYLLKNVDSDSLAEAIRAASKGQSRIAPEATHALVQAAYRPSPPESDLTERELEVLELLIEGLNNVQIAERLFVSRSTVKFHVSGILSKLNVNSRTEAVVYALKNGLTN